MSTPEILLIRHGKPALPPAGWLTARAFGDWISRYDGASVDDAVTPPQALLERLQGEVRVVSSDLPRACDSAALLVAVPDPGDPLFREAALPWRPFPSPPLPAPLWLLLFRLVWLAGAGSRRSDGQRARHGARRLDMLARSHGKVALVGHGIFNRLIGTELKRLGWRRRARWGSGYWSGSAWRPEEK